jgi:tRNA 2-thiouridine synthesizing protein E
MATTTIAGAEVTVDEEGFMTEYEQWNEEIAAALATNIGIELGESHWQVIKFLREDYKEQGETPMLRRVSNVGGVSTKELFQLFPKKPAKKMSYVAGVPKPHGCV